MSVATASPATLGPEAAAGASVAPLRILPPATTEPDGRPALRLLPAPGSEPPYDDELTPRRALHPVGSAAPALLPVTPAPAPVRLRLVPQRQDPPPAASAFGSALDDDDDVVRSRTPLAQLPAPRPFAHALVQRLLEVQAGLRPLSQLQRDTSFELFTELEQTLPRRPRQAGPRPTRRDVRSVHVQASQDGVAEVCATVHRSGRSTALALRLEGVGGAWRCTALLGV